MEENDQLAAAAMQSALMHVGNQPLTVHWPRIMQWHLSAWTVRHVDKVSQHRTEKKMGSSCAFPAGVPRTCLGF